MKTTLKTTLKRVLVGTIISAGVINYSPNRNRNSGSGSNIINQNI